jgi:thioredoxin reductase/Fe-S-cluster-containing hydrogenase component 2/CRP-like cAMP-binding protein
MGERFAMKYDIAIVGAGPAGLSAAAQAAANNITHIVLEAAPHAANTIYHYQKRKSIMTEPLSLPLRSALPFSACSREELLAAWQATLDANRIHLRCTAEVTTLSGTKGNFVLTLANGDCIHAATVVLALGVQGNPRRLDVPGCEQAEVQYQLDDADSYRDQTIVIIGAGDAAIENALALAAHNDVILINRRAEFSRAQAANADAINNAIHNGQLDCLFSTRIEAISRNPEVGGKALILHIKTPEAPALIMCDHIIARLGAVPPHYFLAHCGVRFPNNNPDAVPQLSPCYESSVAGIFIIGALAGYPLIKQALNQGYDVIELLCGHTIMPADEPLLRDKFKVLPAFQSVTDTLAHIRHMIPLLSTLTPLQLREFILGSTLHAPKPGNIIFKYNDYTNTFFSIFAGEVRISISPKDSSQVVTLRQGQFFGEMSLISGRRRSASVYAGSGQQCILIETPRRLMLKLMNSVPLVKRMIDEVFIMRAIHANIAPEIPHSDLGDLVHSAEIHQFAAGDILFREGEEADCLHLVRLGSVTLSRHIGDQEIILSYTAAGNYIGETALLSNLTHPATARAAVATETIKINGSAFKALLARYPSLHHQIEAKLQQRLAQSAYMESRPQAGNIISFLVSQGLGEATDVLLIDESLCIGCEHCERACAETHNGTSRLKREAGASFAAVHVPTSCRHCEHPHCMKDCPPDAIHRAPNGEVYIADNCIGCGNCQRNCPYGVIQMAAPQRSKPRLLWWLLFGCGAGPGGKTAVCDNSPHKAVKCDMCQNLRGGPACVRACPTGAAFRVSPEAFMSIAQAQL